MTKMGVRADGVMVPCTQLSHINLGRINQDPLREVWQHHPELTRLRERQQIPLGEFEFCRDCAYIPFCTGNCPALAYNLLGEENHPSPDACLQRFLEAGGRLPGEGSEKSTTEAQRINAGARG
jgi:SynChlorMet cassette radical SAM/SPASM protein ScmE